MFLLFVGWEKITASVRRHNTVAALLSYTGTYYILDFEYPQNQELGFFPRYLYWDILHSFNNILVEKYNKCNLSG